MSLVISALLSRRGAAGDACVQVLGAAPGQGRVQLDGGARRRGAEVDDDLAGPTTLQHARRAEYDRFDD
jgi:hypothetical protein